MTKSSLDPGQRQTVELIEALGFGVIARLLIRRVIRSLASFRRSNWIQRPSSNPMVVRPT